MQILPRNGHVRLDVATKPAFADSFPQFKSFSRERIDYFSCTNELSGQITTNKGCGLRELLFPLGRRAPDREATDLVPTAYFHYTIAGDCKK